MVIDSSLVRCRNFILAKLTLTPMTQNKVSDCHGAEMDSHYSSDEEGSNDFYSCRKCGRNCSPVEAKKLDVETFLAESEEAGAALKRKDAKNVNCTGLHCKCMGKGCPNPLESSYRCLKCFCLKFSPARRPTEGWEERFQKEFAELWKEAVHNSDTGITNLKYEIMSKYLKIFFAAELAKKDDYWLLTMNQAIETDLGAYRAELEKIREKLHNGEDVYQDIVNLSRRTYSPPKKPNKEKGK